MSKSSMRQRYREWARDIVEHADADERTALAEWARRLLEIRGSGDLPPMKLQRALLASSDLKVSRKLFGLLGSEFRRVGWDERDTLERTGIAAAATMALLTSFGMVALAAVGGTLSVPAWIVFGPGAEFAEILAEVAGSGASATAATGGGVGATPDEVPSEGPLNAGNTAPEEPTAEAEVPAGASQGPEISEPAVLIRLSRQYRADLSEDQLYEITRGVWRVAKEKRERLEYALAVADDVVREVYRIDAWHPAGTTRYLNRPDEEVRIPGRWEFTGSRAPDRVRDKYLGCSVAGHFKRGNPNPIHYVNL